ncbi:hypothetical protein [Vibrio superstes]|uniref:Uncharacterized protein n=1 Tax=Vibrio superstes NBRC 103154 TaxID=1219062 RepID=A0A511QNL0_9VIBR|nr:hypothetical protein [Vibrio superstes]GEM78921.1 hypothetical protein VSU01S_11660 [Vibrio superstes NBRC 103154]
MNSVKIGLCIGLLTAYVLSWVLLLFVPTMGFEEAQADLYTSYLLIAEELLLLACVIVIGPMFAMDMKAKLTGNDSSKK